MARSKSIKVHDYEKDLLDEVNDERFGGELAYGQIIQYAVNEAYGIDVPIVANDDTGVTF
ncbi:hypothetical protein GL213_09960 [Halogeometricum borinquense]|uniref:Uncharacterized protein n=1 Tax=Halogeometricum borinquense (strain ATCC 700274 / DSM 11551 / JCM 10706 / KCTC 4070 / PR3) TaxID=469382 RepID=E4NP30_HALBP|nr:hypothetical protein [Halogeometricum borinquense]ADQ67571.1 hypothetical protein Hbor_20050 [Halogeometricum borinquense DSM 11551]ELY23749.1 hypothetical protein C499_18399 [Halogeometricum borinquense DSM 11551]QIQ76809.1 hypothetical protein GL213_09960 [Halogeometricum borinquense]